MRCISILDLHRRNSSHLPHASQVKPLYPRFGVLQKVGASKLPVRTVNTLAAILGGVFMVVGLLLILQSYGMISQAIMLPIIFVIIVLSAVGAGIYVEVKPRLGCSATSGSPAFKQALFIYCGRCDARNSAGTNFCGK